MKATHNGTCQVCGRLQKLPAGILSSHGYTVDWGYFSGVCFGAREKPLETSRAVLDEHMQALEAEAKRLDTAEPSTIVCVVAKRSGNLWATKTTREKKCDGRVENTIEAFRALAEPNRDRWINYSWYTHAGRDVVVEQYERAVESERAAMRRNAAGMRAHVAHMRALADSVHGRDLEAI